MSKEDAEEIARLKAAIQTTLAGRIPSELGGASVQRVRDYKAAINDAKKAIAATKPTLKRMQQAFAGLQIFYNER